MVRLEAGGCLRATHRNTRASFPDRRGSVVVSSSNLGTRRRTPFGLWELNHNRSPAVIERAPHLNQDVPKPAMAVATVGDLAVTRMSVGTVSVCIPSVTENSATREILETPCDFTGRIDVAGIAGWLSETLGMFVWACVSASAGSRGHAVHTNAVVTSTPKSK
jgi:hypothetical protein